MTLRLRLLEALTIAAFIPGHNLVCNRIRPGSYDVACVDEGCDFKCGFIISETTHSSYKEVWHEPDFDRNTGNVDNPVQESEKDESMGSTS